MISILFDNGINHVAVETEKANPKVGWTKSVDCNSAL